MAELLAPLAVVVPERETKKGINPTGPARCKTVGQPFQADAVYLVCAKPGGLDQPGKADVHTLRCRIKAFRAVAKPETGNSTFLF